MAYQPLKLQRRCWCGVCQLALLGRAHALLLQLLCTLPLALGQRLLLRLLLVYKIASKDVFRVPSRQYNMTRGVPNAWHASFLILALDVSKMAIHLHPARLQGKNCT